MGPTPKKPDPNPLSVGYGTGDTPPEEAYPELRMERAIAQACAPLRMRIAELEKRVAAMREVLADVDDSSMEDSWNQELKDSVKQILWDDVVAKLEATMQCNCDLDRWQPEEKTGHSWVCRIHKQAITDMRKG
ncbi:MAG: hypothetical protein ACYTBJ_01700 [Planctomycetota bacterium]|jgi:hypothetical protein